MQPAFHRQRVAAYGETMAAYAARQAADWHDGAVLDIHEEMMAVTRAIVAKTLFDADVSEEARAIGDASEIVMEYFGKRLGSLLASSCPCGCRRRRTCGCVGRSAGSTRSSTA